MTLQLSESLWWLNAIFPSLFEALPIIRHTILIAFFFLFLFFLALLKCQGLSNLFHHMSLPFGAKRWHMQVFGSLLREDERCKLYLFCLHGCIYKFPTIWSTFAASLCIYFSNAVWRCIQDGWWLRENEFQTYFGHVQCYNGRIFSRGDILGFGGYLCSLSQLLFLQPDLNALLWFQL